MNAQDALALGSEQSRHFSTLLSSKFHTSMKVKAMVVLKKAVTVIYDVETLFNRLLVVGSSTAWR